MKNRIRRMMMQGLAFLLIFSLLTGCKLIEKQQAKRRGETSEEESEVPQESSIAEESSDAETPAPIPAKGGKLIVSMVMMDVYNPLLVTDEYAAQAFFLLYSPLLEVDETGTLQPSIAVEWTMSEDNREAELTINPAAKWSNGKKVTAWDVDYSISVLMRYEESSFHDCVKYVSGSAVKDDEHLTVYFTRSSPLNLNRLYFPVVSSDYYSNATHATEPMGSGPYKVVSYERMERFVLTENPEYFGKHPYITDAEIMLTRSEVRMDSFDRGITNLVYSPDIPWSTYMNNGDVTLHTFSTSELEAVTFNLNEIRERDQRKAIAYALDAQRILRSTLVDKGDVTEVPISPVRWYGPTNPSRYGQSSEKVAELLDMTEQHRFTILINSEDELETHIAEEMRAEMAEQGIILDIRLKARTEYLQDLIDRNYELALERRNVDSDIELADMLISDQNYPGYVSSQMSDRISQISSKTAAQDVHQGFVSVGDQLADDLPYYCLFFKKQASMTGAGIYGHLTPSQHHVFRGVEDLYMVTANGGQ
ncbi:MAG: hypothetical protein K6A77_04610 [Clostridiales bacterium]|nr:hypothetical protein [Clostridiales bacterium]